MDDGFVDFAVAVYWHGFIELGGCIYSVLIEDMAPQTVDAALKQAVGENSIVHVLKICAEMCNTMFAMEGAGFSICDAGPNNWAMLGSTVRMLDWEHIVKAPQQRSKQNETFLRAIACAAEHMVKQRSFVSISSSLRRILFDGAWMNAGDAMIRNQLWRDQYFQDVAKNFRAMDPQRDLLHSDKQVSGVRTPIDLTWMIHRLKLILDWVT